MKFPKEGDKDLGNLKEKLSKSINRKYSWIVIKSPHDHSDFQTIVIFSVGYLIHMIFFIYFPLNRAIFNLRFIFDVYHIIIFQINGLFVSDYYLHSQFEKIFSSKFLEYETSSRNNPNVSNDENENQNISKPTVFEESFNLPKSFQPSNYGKVQDFANELQNRLKTKQTRIFRRRDSEKSITSLFANSKKNDSLINNQVLIFIKFS